MEYHFKSMWASVLGICDSFGMLVRWGDNFLLNLGYKYIWVRLWVDKSRYYALLFLFEKIKKREMMKIQKKGEKNKKGKTKKEKRKKEKKWVKSKFNSFLFTMGSTLL